MSLESLSALSQLIETRSNGANVQNDTLEKVQGEVQQQGTSEAARIDNVNLEQIKAVYEEALSAARVAKLQAQLAREAMATTVATVIAFTSLGLGAADMIWNATKDAFGHQNLGDSNDEKVDEIDPTKAQVLPPNLNSSGGSKNFVVEAGAGNKDSETVYMAERTGNGSVTSVGAASISKGDIAGQLGKSGLSGSIDTKKATELGLLDKDGKVTDKGNEFGFTLSKDGKSGTIDISKVKNFADLNKLDPKAAESLFNVKGHDVKVSEADNFLNALGVNTKSTLGKVGGAALIGVSALSVPVTGGLGVSGIESGLSLMGADGVKRHEMGTQVEDKLKADGKYVNGDTKLGNFAKSTLNGVIQLAESVVPFFQAMLAARDKAQNTAEDLQMAVAKQAAAAKKIKQLQMLIENAGANGLSAA